MDKLKCNLIVPLLGQKMSDAQVYYEGLITQGHAAESAAQYTQQHFPGFVPAMVVPAPAPAPMMAAPAIVTPMATQPVVVVQHAVGGSQSSALVAYIIWFFLGWLGVHHLYMGRGIGIWLLSLITLQGFGLWWLIDLFLIPSSCSKIR